MGPGFKFLGTKLDSFEAKWILELDPALNPSLNLGSPKHELSFEHFVFWKLESIDFSLQNDAYEGLTSICPYLVLDLHLTAKSPIYGSQPIGILYFTGPWTLDLHLKWP
jgi:hypothetical protein